MSPPPCLPYLPFARPTITPAMAAAVTETLLSQWIASGPQVAAFEAALSAYHGGRPARTFTSATAALEVALQVVGIRPGDEVITSAMTFFSVGNAILRAGATPVFVDCDPVTRNIGAAAVARAITPRTRAIVPTHFGGLACDMDAMHALAAQHGLRVIEDAALAIGSRHRGRLVGSFGDIAVFSFHPNKNMTTIEGGAALFADEAQAARAATLRFHGIARRADGTRDVMEAGTKANLSDVSARLGLEQLAALDGWCRRRQGLAARYLAALSPDAGRLGLTLPAAAEAGEEAEHSWNLFCIGLPPGRDRKAFMDALAARGIGSGISYEALHLTTLFRARGHREGECPHAERIAATTVTLPLFASMADADVDRVAAAVTELLA